MKKFRIIYLVIVLFISSCSPTTYVHNNLNIPLFKGEKEKQIAGYLSPKRLELHAAYAINSEIAIIASGYTKLTNITDQKRINDEQESCGLIDVGFGYHSLANDNLEVFFGISHAWASADIRRYWGYDSWNFDRYYYNSNHNKLFAQIHYGLFSKKIDMGLACRLSFVHYPKYEFYRHSDYYDSGDDPYGIDDVNINNAYGLVIDPVIYFQTKNKIKFCANFGYSTSFFNIQNNYSFVFIRNWGIHPHYERLILNFGLKYVI